MNRYVSRLRAIDGGIYTCNNKKLLWYKFCSKKKKRLNLKFVCVLCLLAVGVARRGFIKLLRQKRIAEIIYFCHHNLPHVFFSRTPHHFKKTFNLNNNTFHVFFLRNFWKHVFNNSTYTIILLFFPFIVLTHSKSKVTTTVLHFFFLLWAQYVLFIMHILFIYILYSILCYRC